MQETDNPSYYLAILNNTAYSVLETVVFLKSLYEETQATMYAVYIYC